MRFSDENEGPLAAQRVEGACLSGGRGSPQPETFHPHSDPGDKKGMRFQLRRMFGRDDFGAPHSRLHGRTERLLKLQLIQEVGVSEHDEANLEAACAE